MRCELVRFDFHIGNIPNGGYIIIALPCVLYLEYLAGNAKYDVVEYSITVIRV